MHYGSGGEPAARVGIFLTQFRVQNRVKTKLHDQEVLEVACHKKLLSVVLR